MHDSISVCQADPPEFMRWFWEKLQYLGCALLHLLGLLT